MTLGDIMAWQFLLHPEMEIADAVKLIYQNEFGCGHLIVDPLESLAGIREEMTDLTADAAEPLKESIGNGLCRMNLRSCIVNRIGVEAINRAFVITAQTVYGTVERFEGKLSSLVMLPFDPEALAEYLRVYKMKGYFPVHHSNRYRRAYAPAYRVILEALV
jgi:hypothetical protein